MKKVYAASYGVSTSRYTGATVHHLLFEDKKIAEQYIKDYNEQHPNSHLFLEELKVFNQKQKFKYRKYTYLKLECSFEQNGEITSSEFKEIITNNIDTPENELKNVNYKAGSVTSFSSNPNKISSYITRKITVKEILEEDSDILTIKEKMFKHCQELYTQSISYNQYVDEREVERRLNGLKHKLNFLENSYTESLKVITEGENYKEYIKKTLNKIEN